MQVKLKVARAGDHFVQERGDVIEVPDAEGRRMIQRGQAEEVKPEGPKGREEKR